MIEPTAHYYILIAKYYLQVCVGTHEQARGMGTEETIFRPLTHLPKLRICILRLPTITKKMVNGILGELSFPYPPPMLLFAFFFLFACHEMG